MRIRTITSLDELNQFVAAQEQAGQQVFVRYSRGPFVDRKRGVSLNHQTGRSEAGLSCNLLNVPEFWTANGDPAVKHLGWVAMQVRDYSYMLYQGGPGTRGWILTGEEVARGSDNEPLVGAWRPVAWLDQAVIDQAATVE